MDYILHWWEWFGAIFALLALNKRMGGLYWWYTTSFRLLSCFLLITVFWFNPGATAYLHDTDFLITEEIKKVAADNYFIYPPQPHWWSLYVIPYFWSLIYFLKRNWAWISIAIGTQLWLLIMFGGAWAFLIDYVAYKHQQAIKKAAQEKQVLRDANVQLQDELQNKTLRLLGSQAKLAASPDVKPSRKYDFSIAELQNWKLSFETLEEYHWEIFNLMYTKDIKVAGKLVRKVRFDMIKAPIPSDLDSYFHRWASLPGREIFKILRSEWKDEHWTRWRQVLAEQLRKMAEAREKAKNWRYVRSPITGSLKKIDVQEFQQKYYPDGRRKPFWR